MNKIDLPYMRINQANELLKKLSPSFIEKQATDLAKISKALGVKRSTVSNLLTTLKSLNLLEGRGKYNFTDYGKQYIRYLIRNNDDKSRDILRSIAEELDYIREIKEWLEQKGKLKIEDIGNQLALKYNQKWENPLTVKAYGAAISSILDYIGDASYRTGTLFLKKAEHRAESISIPDAHTKKILDILAAIFPNGKDFHELSEKLKTTEGRLSSEILCCLELGLVERVTRGFYKLTDAGEKILSPVTSEQSKKAIFCERLLASRYGKILNELKTEETSVEQMGDILKYSLAREWNAQTSKTFARKFIDWLLYAGIMEKEGKKYKIIDRKSLEVIPELAPKDKIDREQSPAFKPVDPIRYYLLGKYIGQILHPNVPKDVVKDTVSKIVAFCREDYRLKEVLEGWKEDYELYPDLDDPRIFLRDIKSLEKALGVKL